MADKFSKSNKTPNSRTGTKRSRNASTNGPNRPRSDPQPQQPLPHQQQHSNPQSSFESLIIAAGIANHGLPIHRSSSSVSTEGQLLSGQSNSQPTICSSSSLSASQLTDNGLPSVTVSACSTFYAVS